VQPQGAIKPEVAVTVVAAVLLRHAGTGGDDVSESHE
jgi:hypothetical protein